MARIQGSAVFHRLGCFHLRECRQMNYRLNPLAPNSFLFYYKVNRQECCPDSPLVVLPTALLCRYSFNQLKDETSPLHEDSANFSIR